MLYEIEQAVATRIDAKLAAAGQTISVVPGMKEVPRPSVYVFMQSGGFEKVSQASLRVNVTGIVSLVFSGIMDYSNLSEEATRRRGIYIILETVVQAVMLQTLSLDIKPLLPKSFKDVTPDDYRERGILIYNLEIETSYHLAKVDDEVLVDLLRVGLNYYLQDPSDDNVVDASDLLERQLPFMAGLSGARDRLYEEGLGLDRPVEP